MALFVRCDDGVCQESTAPMPLLQELVVAAASVSVMLAATPNRHIDPSPAVQAPDYVCPLRGSPAIRSGDAVAHSGGHFDSSRDGGRQHGALDLNSTEGAPVRSAHAGVVAVSADDWGPYGSAIIIDHGDGMY